MFGIGTNKEAIALASAITYWVFRCRDRAKSPAMGLKTWEYVQSSIKNSAIPARDLNDYIENLSAKLVVPTLKPKEWNWVIKPNCKIHRVFEDGRVIELDSDQDNLGLQFISWEDVLNSLATKGITNRKVLSDVLKYPHVITTFVRVRYEEDKAIGAEEIEDFITVETND